MVGLFALLLALPDTLPLPRPVDSVQAATTATAPQTAAPMAALSVLPVTLRLPMEVPSDTGARKRVRSVEYSEWYGRRVAVHKALSWAMLPLFAVSYYTGTQLADKGRAGVSSTVRTLHPIAATGDAVLFGVNTVTGVWNLWAARHDPSDRKRRYLHSALFILADAGFAYAGSLGEEAKDNGAIRRKHRNIALGSMGVSTAGWLVMLLKRD